jgi:hypothetical protein
VVSSGISRPPPTPCSTRKPIRAPTFQAAPDSTDPARNTTSEKIQVARPPNRASAQPLSGMTMPKDSR